MKDKIAIFLILEQDDMPEQLNEMKNIRYLKIAGYNPIQKWIDRMVNFLIGKPPE